jgi:deoxycytidine triphosphate deaminase
MSIVPLHQWKQFGIKVRNSGASGDPSADLVGDFIRETPERVAFDLHLADEVQVDERWVKLNDDGLVLRPNETVRIRVLEELETPPDVFGQICSKGGLTPEGLIVGNQKIDPNFGGRLEPVVFNAAKTSLRIKKNQAFACIWFATLTERPPDLPMRSPTPTKGIEQRDLRETWRAFRPFVVTGVVSTASTVAAAVLLKLL